MRGAATPVSKEEVREFYEVNASCPSRIPEIKKEEISEDK